MRLSVPLIRQPSYEMALTRDDLQAIEQIFTGKLEPVEEDLKGIKSEVNGIKLEMKTIREKLEPIEADLKEMKIDLKFLAALNQLEEIKKDPRLKRLYEGVS